MSDTDFYRYHQEAFKKVPVTQIQQGDFLLVSDPKPSDRFGVVQVKRILRAQTHITIEFELPPPVSLRSNENSVISVNWTSEGNPCITVHQHHGLNEMVYILKTKDCRSTHVRCAYN